MDDLTDETVRRLSLLVLGETANTDAKIQEARTELNALIANPPRVSRLHRACMRMVEVKPDPFSTGRQRGAHRYSFSPDGEDDDGNYNDQASKETIVAKFNGNQGSRPLKMAYDLCLSARSYIEAEVVVKFMVGVASSPKKEHLHSGMQNRASTKYSKHGYRRYVALALYDGAEDNTSAAEVESHMHRALGTHRKYDWSLSDARTSRQPDDANDSYFVVYIALLKVINDED